MKSSIIMYGAVLSVTAVFEVLGAILLVFHFLIKTNMDTLTHVQGYWSDRKYVYL